MKLTHRFPLQELKTQMLTGIVVGVALVSGAMPPPNDNFADRAALTGTEAVVSASTEEATNEPGEQEFLPQTVWWSWTAPVDGLAEIQIPGRGVYDFLPECLVFTGSELAHLTLVTNSSFLQWWSHALFPISSGTTYQIAVGGVDTHGNGGQVILTLATGSSPRNDDFGSTFSLGSGNAHTIGSNRLASGEADEPWSIRDGTVWWSWTAPRSGHVSVTVEEISDDPPIFLSPYAGGIVSVFTGDELPKLSLVPSSTDLYRSIPTLVQESFEAVAGRSYHVRVGGYFGLAGRFTLNLAQTLLPVAIVTSPAHQQTFNAAQPVRLAAQTFDADGSVARTDFYLGIGDGDIEGYSPRFGTPLASLISKPFVLQTNLPPGDYTLTAIATDNVGAKSRSMPISFWVRPPNDDYGRRGLLTGASVSVGYSTDFATRELGEPTSEGGTVWWSWTAPANASFTLSAEGGARFVEVYSGSTLADLTRIAEGRPTWFDGYGITIQTSFSATAGAVYSFAVSGGNRLRLTPGLPPTLSFISPTNEAVFFIGETLILRCEARDPDGSVRRVDFFDHNGLTNTITTPPFDLPLVLTNAGFYFLRAVATDDQGMIGYSEEVQFYVSYPPPANDLFTHRILLTGASLTTTGSVSGATLEIGESFRSSGSAWWSWTAPASGAYTITVVGRNYFPALGVYSGSVLAELTPVGNEVIVRDVGSTTRVVLNATAGTIYALAVGGGDFSETVVLSIMANGPPSVRIVNPQPGARFIEDTTIAVEVEAADADGNVKSVDIFYDGELIGRSTHAPHVANITLRKGYIGRCVQAVATDDQELRTLSENVCFYVHPKPPSNDRFANRIALTGAPITVAQSLEGVTAEEGEPNQGEFAWWSWTASRSGIHTITATTPGYYPFLGVYTGASVADLRLVAENRFNGQDRPSYAARVTVNAEAGRTYVLGVASGSEVKLDIFPTAPPSVRVVSPTNNAEFIQGNAITLAAVATADGRVKRVEFFIDDHPVGSATNAPFQVVFTSPYSYASHGVRAEATDDVGNTAFSEELRFAIFPRPPLNDDFARRELLTGAIATAVSVIDRASLESDEPGIHAPGWGSVWWSWTPPIAGSVMMRATPVPSYDDAALEVYTGASLANLVAVARGVRQERQSLLRFTAVAGTEYHLRYVSPSGFERVSLSILLDGLAVGPMMKSVEGTFTARFRDTLERFWQIEASTDLVSWDFLGTALSADGVLEWQDAKASEFPQRFYRLLPDP